MEFYETQQFGRNVEFSLGAIIYYTCASRRKEKILLKLLFKNLTKYRSKNNFVGSLK